MSDELGNRLIIGTVSMQMSTVVMPVSATWKTPSRAPLPALLASSEASEVHDIPIAEQVMPMTVQMV